MTIPQLEGWHIVGNVLTEESSSKEMELFSVSNTVDKLVEAVKLDYDILWHQRHGENPGECIHQFDSDSASRECHNDTFLGSIHLDIPSEPVGI